MQPMTIMFKVAGVDMDRAMFFWGFEDTVQLPEGDLQTLGRQELPSPAGHILLYPSSLPRRCHSQHEQYDRCGRHKCKRSESC